jgi:hypothetical protein
MDRKAELEWITARPIDAVRAWAESKLLPALAHYGFRVEQRTADSVLLTRRRTAWWLAFFSVIAFWLSPDERGYVSVSFSADADAASRMMVTGNVPAKIRRILLDMPGCTEVFSRV